MNRKRYSCCSRACPLILLCLATLAVQEISAQIALGHRQQGERIIVDRADHWRHWTGPTHVIDVLPDGTLKPHFFRQVYDIIAEDRDLFAKPVDQPGIRKKERAIMNLRRTPALEEDGSLTLGKAQQLIKFLDRDFLRFPGNDSHMPVGGQLQAIIDTALSSDGNTVTLTLRNERSASTSTRVFGAKDKIAFPVYDYVQRVGVSRVGSNEDLAPRIVDGDRSTYWEPDLEADPDKWWIEVDLARTVVVEKVVLHFVDAELGDPFRQFRVLLAPQQKLIQGQSRVLQFKVVGQTRAPNTDQRTMAFSSADTPGFSDDDDGRTGWTGRMAQVVRILIADSKLGRARQIDEIAWNALPPDERGDVLHYIRDVVGFEEPVDQDIYESLPAQQQGRKEYYIRDRPRLAEVEVWGWGDNLSPLVIGGGGSVSFTGPEVPAGGFDGDWNTSFRMPAWFSSNPTAGILTVDIGARVWLDAMRLAVPFIPGYIAEAADGSRDPNGRLRWRQISAPDRMEGGFRRAVDRFDPPLQIRFLNLRLPGIVRTSGFFYALTEVLLYTEGFVGEAPMTSDIIRLPGPRNFGAIRWDPPPGAQPPGTESEVRTRTGDLLVQQIRHFDVNGNEKTKTEWGKLISSWKGPIDTTFALGGGWSPWSQKYLQPGDQVSSPGLRRFLQLQVRFTSRDRFQAASIRSIEVELASPVARSLVAEVWPAQAVPGRMDTFDLYLRSTFIDEPAVDRTPGFDEILLQAPPGVDLHLFSLSVGTEEELGQDRPFQSFTLTADGNLADASGAIAQVLRNDSDSVWVRLPQLHETLPTDVAVKTYNRITPQGAEIVVGEDGEPITEASYALLDEAKRGTILYLRETAAGLEPVSSRAEYDDLLPEEQGPVRYFRKPRGDGAQSPFDALGDSLTRSAYNALPRSERGAVLGEGRLIHLRFAAAIYRNGTTFKPFVRRSAAGTGGNLWQQVDPGDATDLTDSRELTLSLPVGAAVLDDLTLSPNPFTPNGDGVNDELAVAFSVFEVTLARQARLRVYELGGRLVWKHGAPVAGGAQQIRWNGTDTAGRTVPPGLYICQIDLSADSDQAVGTTLSRVVAVVY
jgi:hypothetical protein